MFIKNSWQVAAFAHEVGRSLLARQLAGVPVILYRTEAGKAVALEDRCAHRYVPLSLGKLIGDVVQCGYHGLCYNAEGHCTKVWGQERVPPAASVRAYPVVERYDFVWIWLGDPASADAEMVPNFFWMTDPGWTISEGYHHLNAHYQLIIDNLLDLSHESFVHTETIGNDAVAESPLTVSVKDGHEVRAHRDMLNCLPPPFYVKATGYTSRIDRWHTSIFTPPGFIVIENGAMPAGSNKEDARAIGNTRERRVLNLITPETETSSHYFWAIARSYDRDNSELTGYIRDQIRITFDQDKAILEAQQRSISQMPTAHFPVVLGTDAGVVQGRRLIDAHLKQLDGRARASDV